MRDPDSHAALDTSLAGKFRSGHQLQWRMDANCDENPLRNALPVLPSVIEALDRAEVRRRFEECGRLASLESQEINSAVVPDGIRGGVIKASLKKTCTSIAKYCLWGARVGQQASTI
jgi:hypothetical protein